MKPSCFLAILALAAGSVAFAQTKPTAPPLPAGEGLPDPQPPFQIKDGKRQAVALKTYDVVARSNKVKVVKTVEAAALCSGNKQLVYRSQLHDADDIFSIFVDDKSIGTGKVFFMEPAKGAVAELKVDKAKQTITSIQEYVVSAGKTAKLAHTLRPLGDGRIAVDWAWDSPTEAGLAFCFFINGSHYRGGSVTCNDAPLALTPLDGLSATARLLQKVEGPARIVVAPDKPLASFGVEVGQGYTVTLMEQGGTGDPTLRIWLHAGKTANKGSFVVDLGVTAVKDASAPPPIGKIDFWASDATHVPAPTTRNLKANPGFEQGLRYWTWWFGGGKYVPSNTPAYSISNDARFGKKSLLVRKEGGGMAIMSLPIPVEKDADYTVSFYAKGEQDKSSFCLGVQSALRTDGSKMGWQQGFKYRHDLTRDWQRYTFTFKSDTAAIALLIGPGGSPVWVDGIQVEKGTVATDFTAPEVEGLLRTSDPDCMVQAGQKINASFELAGNPNASGDVRLSVLDYYREQRFQKRFAFTLGKDGTATMPLPLDALKLGTGVFVVRADYALPGKPPYSDYYRFSVVDFLENKHATKNLFGNLFTMRHPRAADLGRNFMRWGFGSTSYSYEDRATNDYRIDNFSETIYSHLTPDQHDDYFAAMEKWTEFTPERIKRIEDICADVVKRNPTVPVWAPTCEVEGKTPLVIAGNYDEWAKFQAAAFRGIKRSNPKAIVLPDTGTSGLNRLRGFREQEGYLRSTQGLAKWDAMAAHPYGSMDGTCGHDDLDDTTARFIELMAKYHYGPETPIYYSEGFNLTDTRIPEWGSGGAYDNYGAGRASYDSGWREFVQAAWVARTYLICLKYWPRVSTFNIWVSAPCVDMDFAPLFLTQVPNTLGHLLGNPRYKADIRPTGGVRGYAFEDEQGRGLAAIWCAMDQVDNGAARGPEMRARFGDQLPEFIDLMGNSRQVKPKDGEVSIQLTPAPLFLRCPAGGLPALLKALDAARILGAGSALSVDAQPQPDGRMELVLTNQTSSAMAGKLTVSGEQRPFDVPARGKTSTVVPGSGGTAPGKLHTWRKGISVEFEGGRKSESLWDTEYFYVPHAPKPLPLDPAAAEWQTVPAIPVTNWFVQTSRAGAVAKPGGPGDLSASYQLAWDADNLYLRVSASDDRFVLTDAARWRDSQLYMHDGCAEVYLDTGANGRSNPAKGYDLDDYRYDFSAGDAKAGDGPGRVYRLREAYHQLAGGLNMPTKEEASKGVKCQFHREGNQYAYVMVFPQRYIEPLKLEKGWRAGFGLFLHDKEPGEDWSAKGLSLATEPGSHCDNKPHLWPVMVLGD